MKLTAPRAGIAAIAAAALLLTGCAGGEPSAGSSGGTLTIANLAEPTSFDPAHAQEGYFMAYYQAVYDSLLRRTPTGELEPMLATDWSYNDDNTVLTLNLRSDVTFTDGAAFDAAAAKANLEHFMTAGGTQGSTMNGVTSVDVVDDDTITLTLSAPDPALLIYLSNAAGLMASPDALDDPELATTPVGSGPYTLDTANTQAGSQYTFVKRDDYWSPDLQQYDEIVIKYMPDPTARINALISGQIQGAPLDAKTATQADAAGLIEHAQPMDWRGLVIADRDGAITPALADERVRQAINYALDGPSMLESIEGGRGELTSQIFGVTSTAYVEELDTAYSYDPERARELLAEAGYPDGFTFDLPTIDVLDPSLWPVLQQQLGDVGITVNLVPVPASDYIVQITGNRFPIFYMSLFEPPTWVTVNQAISPVSLFNPYHTQRDEVDRLMTEIQTAPDAEAEKGPAQELNRYIVEQAWFAPVYRPDNLFYTNDSVEVDLQTQQAYPSIYNFSPAN